MQILFHIGAHCTEAARLPRALRRDLALLEAHRVAVPRPADYRAALRDASLNLRGASADGATQRDLLAAAGVPQGTERVILSNPNFLCMGQVAIEGGHIYPKSHKSTWLRNLFPDHEVAFILAIRNPATWLPALHGAHGAGQAFADFLGVSDLTDFRWSPFIERLGDANPDCAIALWCNEDTPFVWPDVLRHATGLEAHVPMIGDEDILEEVMAPVGIERLRSYLAAHPPSTAPTRRRIVGAFLEKFALEAAIEEEIDIPGWDEALIRDITEVYEADLGAIRRMPRVTLIEP